MELSWTETSWFATTLLITLVILNGPLYWMLYRILFIDLDELIDALKFWVTPELISALRGEYVDDIWAELKLGVLLGTSVAAVYLEFAGLHRFFTG